MKNHVTVFALGIVLTIAVSGAAMATPSTQIWIPSTDVQGFGTFHVGIDNYIRLSRNSTRGRDPNVYDIGPVAGFLPFKKLQGEIGFDFLGNGTDPNDSHPWSGNIKIGIPEDSLFKFSPAIAFGGYNLGPSVSKSIAPSVTSGQNIIYDVNGHADNDGVLLSWDRTMSEIPDKLWFAVDYQGSHNVDGALNVGFSWSFAKNVSVIFGYDMYTEKKLAGEDTFTTQLDVNFP